MWTWVDGAEDIATESGFAVGETVAWTVLTDEFEELLPDLPDGFEGDVESAVDEDGDGLAEGTVLRIVMLTGRRTFAQTEITATPAEHVQVLDLVGFLVEVGPAT